MQRDSRAGASVRIRQMRTQGLHLGHLVVSPVEVARAAEEVPPQAEVLARRKAKEDATKRAHQEPGEGRELEEAPKQAVQARPLEAHWLVPLAPPEAQDVCPHQSLALAVPRHRRPLSWLASRG